MSLLRRAWMALWQGQQPAMADIVLGGIGVVGALWVCWSLMALTMAVGAGQ